MQRTKKPNRMPDAINQSVTSKFTQVPNDLLRNPDLSFKAKGMLCLLLSNREGWYSYISTILQMTREGEEAIRSGLTELEQTSYLLRVQYRDKKTKVRRGSFWAYTDFPDRFDFKKTLEILDNRGMEPVPGQPSILENPDMEKPDLDSPDLENPRLKRPNVKKPSDKNIESASSDKADIMGKIRASHFEDFWQLYPRKDSKGAAKKVWEKICRRNVQDRPTWEQIEQALQVQKKTERWQERQFIPMSTTWLNQERWLDDPAEMSSFSNKPKPVQTSPKTIIKQSNISSPDQFIQQCYNSAKEILTYSDNGQLPELATNLTALYQEIEGRQHQIKATGNTTKGLPHRMERPKTIIEEYIRWLDWQDWMKDKQPHLFDFDHKLFRKFISEYMHDTGADPITGKYPDQT